jgi:uncharacterized protein (TIGR00725 family)
MVAVVGAAQCSPNTAVMAEAVGRGLGRRGAILVCGGRGGVMEAACRGAKREGGTTVGVLPGVSPKDANPYVDIPIATGLGEARNAVVVQSVQAVIAFPGEYGTLSEIGLALKMGKPVVGLGTWQLWREGRLDKGVRPACSPMEAVEMALNLAASGDD